MSVQAISWAFNQKILPASRKFVLVALSNFASSEGGICFPSIKAICESTGLTKKTVTHALDCLEATGLIEDTTERRGTTHQVKVYQLKEGRKEPPSKGVENIPLNGERGSFLPSKGVVFTPKEGHFFPKGGRKRPTEPYITVKEPVINQHPQTPSCVSATLRKPSSVDEVIAKGQFIGLSEQDCRDWHRDCEACGWLRGDGSPFDNWPKQLVIHRDKLAEKRQRTNNQATGASRPASIQDIKTVIQIKEEKSRQLRDRWSVEGPVSTEWSDDKRKQEYSALRKEIKELKARAERMV